MNITYRIPGDTTGLVFPPKRKTKFRNNLWEHTCFEAFIRPQGGTEYIELNLSPSTEWAAYRFDDYRKGMRAVPGGPHKVVSTLWDNRFELSVGVIMPSHWKDLRWRLNLSAILEGRNGTMSYWALAHPPGKPDFHDDTCFTLELPAAPPA